MAIKIIEARISARGPDSDGDFRMQAAADIKATADEDVDQLRIRQLVRDAAGVPIFSDYQDSEDELEAGDTSTIETSRYLRMPSVEGFTGDIIVDAGVGFLHELPLIDLPEAGKTGGHRADVVFSDGLVVAGFGVRVQTPDSDDDCRVEQLLVIRNDSPHALTKLEVETKFIRRKGTELDDTMSTTFEGLLPGQVTVLDCSRYLKSKWTSKGLRMRTILKVTRNLGTVVARGVPVTLK
jgi:hypothetical protein